jgi:hypothetical protein
MMINEQYSLENLRDIVVPDPPPFWPPAPGVWVMLGIVTAAVLIVFWRLHVARKRNAYRRAGLGLLEEARTANDISVLLKRVALAVFPREQVASLYGKDWIAFLNRTCSRSHFSEMGATNSNTELSQELIEIAGIWIRHHRIPECQTPDKEH